MFSFLYPAIKKYAEVKKVLCDYLFIPSKMSKILLINMGLYNTHKFYSFIYELSQRILLEVLQYQQCVNYPIKLVKSMGCSSSPSYSPKGNVWIYIKHGIEALK